MDNKQVKKSLEEDLLSLADRMKNEEVTGYFILVNLKSTSLRMYNASDWMRLGYMTELMVLGMKAQMLEQLELKSTALDELQNIKYNPDLNGKMN